MTHLQRTTQATLAVVALSAVLGCATARNYEDSAGPIIASPMVAPKPPTHGIRLVTFNIKFADRIDRAVDLLSMPGPLRDADVLVLQEMDAPGTEAVARALRLNSVYVPAAVHPASGRDFGQAILSPWPLDDVRKILLPHLHRTRKMRRVAAVATVHTPSGAVRVYGVHFETPFGASGSARRDQARTIARDAAEWTGPVAIAGDFNGRAAADELSKAGFTWLSRAVSNTAGPFDFDHILVRGLCAAAPAAKAPDTTDASDHMPVWVVVKSCL